MASSLTFDSDTWYRIVSNIITDVGYALDIRNDGFPNGYADLILHPVSDSGGQYWRLLSQPDNCYQLYSMWPGQDYRLGIGLNDSADHTAPADHTALYTGTSEGDPSYDWNIILLGNLTFSLVNQQTMTDLYLIDNGGAWAITEIQPIDSDISSSMALIVTTLFSTLSNPSSTLTAMSLNGSPLPATSSTQTPSSSFNGEFETSVLGYSTAFVSPSSPIQPLNPSRTVDPASFAPTTAPTPNGKLAIQTAVGIGVGTAIGVIFLGAFVVCIIIRRRRGRTSEQHDDHGTEDTTQSHAEAKLELSAQEQQSAKPHSELSARERQCAEPYSELSGDQGKVPHHISELGGLDAMRKYGSNNLTLSELE